jgi:hypothetical protein
MTIPNTTYRILVEKLGSSDPSQFIGNDGEVFYDPNIPALKLSNGLTPGGVSIGGTDGGNDSRITSDQISDWDTAYGWGDHSTAGYISSTSTSYAQTLIVDPSGDDINGNGGPNAPFKTLQKAHDYANDNIPISNQVVVKLNTGNYVGNLSITRPNIHFVGLLGGVTKSTRISGTVNVGVATSVGGAANDMVSFENFLITSNAGPSVMTIGGSIGCAVKFKDIYVFTASSTSKCIDITNIANTGIQLDFKNVILQNQQSSGVTLDLSNTYYANVDQLIVYGGTGASININTTRCCCL